jgi:hypothetical protein
MDHEEGDACVYVKAAVLHELEHERRRLKWQLSRALQTSDSRAAELEASKAKVKDLLTIVEVNKGVADQVVQRSHGRDAQWRAELETLQQQNAQQRQRYVDLALRLMNRRVQGRQQRDAFHLLQQAAALRSRRREALLRLQARTRRRALRRGLESWKHGCCMREHGVAASCSAESAKVHPVSLESLRSLPQAGSTRAKAADTGDAQRLVRRQLLRKAWRDWERVVRWQRRHRAFVRVASERSQRLVVGAWRARVRTLRQRRALLRRILARTRQRLQQLGLTSFRLRCAEVAAHEWAEVLKTAHVAMEEERKLRADVQCSVASELHTAYAREQQRQQRFKELQAQRLEGFKRRECKQRALLTLRCKAIQSRHKSTLALRFQRLQHRVRVLRRLLTTWKRATSRLRRIKTVIAARDARRLQSTKATCFKLLAWALTRLRQRRLRLRSLLFKLRRGWLMHGWLGLRIRSAVEEHKAMAHVEMWELSQQAEAMQTVYHEDVRRCRKVALKYQVTCALLMADKQHEKLLRKLLRRWSRCTATLIRQRRTLRRLAARQNATVLRQAVRKWVHLSEDEAARCSQLEQFQASRSHRVVASAFKVWERKAHSEIRKRLTSRQQRHCFRAWRQGHLLRQQRTQWLGRFLKRLTANWKRHAFRSWKLKHDRHTRASVRRDNAQYELVSRLWRRWVGFVAFRLHQQRLQQQRALRGVRSALQRTILSTAFASWRTTWRHVHEREQMLVRACRTSAGLARGRRYLQEWRRYSALVVRRRSALSRICRRQRQRSLQHGWRRWIRASHCTAIAALESSSLQAQQQVDGVAQSTSRINLLRRTVRGWRVAQTEARRQQRQRALFAEKRRYTTLQATLRQWQRRIACCSLSRQRRILRHLLTKLLLSIERQAFRRWERWAHAHTLFVRDRISAELFRRSEIRVLALAEEVRAGRERRIAFTSWRSITARKKAACETLQRVLLKRQYRLLQSSWVTWSAYAQAQRCIVRLIQSLDRRRKAAAWLKLLHMYHRHDLRSIGVRRAGVIWHRILVRHAWSHWKRSDSFVATHAVVKAARTASTQAILAFKTTLARRHQRKRMLLHVLAAWKQVVVCTTRLRRHLCDVLGRRVALTAAHHFRKWRSVVERQNRIQQLLHRVARRRETRGARVALQCWRRWTLEVAHRLQLDQTQRAMARQREANAKRLAAVKFLSWQRPCLDAHFVRWKAHVEQRRRFVVEQTTALTHRRTRRLLTNAWRWWRGVACQSQRRSHLLVKALTKTRVALLAHGFYRWSRWSSWMQHIDTSLTRLVRIHERRQWRRGFASLRQHHHDVLRRQSVMAASAYFLHSARQRGRQKQTMRAVALILQRKTSAALCDRCFRHWVFYTRTKAKTKSMGTRAHTRAQKRMLRRCFMEWQLCSRQRAVLRHKLRKRQETWAFRRRRSVWHAWRFFTQHSLDVKHSIYERLIICALRHSLQGAWGCWKTYLDAQRTAEWEHKTAERDKVVNTLEDKHERLLLRAAHLGQQNNTLRQRLVTSAAKKLHQVLDLRHKARAFAVWRHKLHQVSALTSRLGVLGLRYQRLALYHWRSTASSRRAVDEIKRAQLDATEWAARVVHTCATQWLKRRTLVTWKALVRARRRIKRHLAATQRRGELQLVQCCWEGWKTILGVRARQQVAVTAFRARRGWKALLQVYWRWRSSHERTGFAKLDAIRRLLLLRRQWQHRFVLLSWSRWKAFTLEEAAAVLHSKLVLVQLDHDKAADLYTCSQLLLRTFSNWKTYACSHHERREGRTRARALESRRRLLLRHFKSWRRRVVWTQTRTLRVRRMERHLRRHYMTLTKFAYWLWFARAQATTQLQVAAKQFTPTTDVPARMARALLTDLLVAEHQLIRAKQRGAWRLVDAAVRGARRRTLRSAFDRLASGGAAVRLKHRSARSANARAFVDKLTLLLLRSGFQRWKQQYVARAIQEAEETQQELLRALHHVTSYRQALTE